MRPAPSHLSYKTGGRSEYCLSFGDPGAPRTMLIVPPLFDEMNRTRHMLAEAMRALASLDIRSLLPDLPGCNESLAALTEQSLDSWRQALADCAEQLTATHIVSIRGGALIDGAVDFPHWRLAPVKGGSLLKTMLRTRIAADKEAGLTTTSEQLLASANDAPLELSGNRLGIDMLQQLEIAPPGSLPGVHEAALADIKGSPLWLRAEPQHDPAMSAALAAELDRWSASCGG